SGDLAPLAHMSLPLIGEGFARVAVPASGTNPGAGDGTRVGTGGARLDKSGAGEFLVGDVMSGSAALDQVGLAPIELRAKEGLALINGTQQMSAQLAAAVVLAQNLMRSADVAAAMTVEGLM